MRITSPLDWKKFSLTRVGIDPDLYEPGNRGQKNYLHLVSVGRLISAKGQYLLIKAMSDLFARGASLKLTIAGEGPERQVLENLTLALGFGK